MLGRLFGHAALAAPAAAVSSQCVVRAAEPSRDGGESAASGDGNSRSLAAVLAASTSYSFRGHEVALGPAEAAPALAPAPGPLAGTKRDAMGTEKQRWANRLDRNVIAAQIAHGCKCGCVDTHATAGDIIAARTLQKDKSGEERRQFLRGLLPGLLNPDTLLGVSLNWGDTNTPACVKGFSLRHGFSESWTYDIVRAYVKDGKDQTNPDYGGRGAKSSGDGVDGPKFSTAYGWFSALWEELEPMPNTNQRQLDFMEDQELFAEFRMDTRASGMPDSDIPTIKEWKRVWTECFKLIKIRKHRQVDSKDKVRAELRRLLCRRETNNATDRAYYRDLRRRYHVSIRDERMFYWRDRLKPSMFPEDWLTLITDGAAQKWYIVPRSAGTDLGRNACQLKVIGTLVHSHVLVIHIVHPHLPDDANLVCHVLDEALEETIKIRRSKGLREYLPTNTRLQLDGVNTNWGKTTIAHVTNLVKLGLLGKTIVARNPVGNTHEDIDAIFALLRDHIIDLHLYTPSALEGAIRDALRTYQLPVVIRHVDATRDYAAHYAPHIDPGLKNFSYSEHTNGYHVFSATPSGVFGEPPACAFKKYQQDEFFTVALNRTELPPPWPAIEDFRPAPIVVHNEWGDCRPPLKVFPDGKPGIAPVVPYEYEGVLRDAQHVLPDHAGIAASRAEWRTWTGARPRSTADIDDALLPQWLWPLRPASQRAGAGAGTGAPPPDEVGGVPVTRMRHVNTIDCSHDGTGAAAARAADAAKRNAKAAELAADEMRESAHKTDALVPDDWVFVKMSYLPLRPGEKGGCRIPWILAQLPSSFGGVDTTKDDAKIKVKWWEPRDKKYTGDWQPWSDAGDGVPAESEIERGSIEFVEVTFTTATVKTKVLNKKTTLQLWKIDAKTKARIAACPESKFSEFS